MSVAGHGEGGAGDPEQQREERTEGRDAGRHRHDHHRETGRAGRVGDSPLPGCGLYADNQVGAVSLSGDGESLIRATLASRPAGYRSK